MIGSGRTGSSLPIDYSDADRWTQDGTFPDVDGTPVRAYDDVILLEEILSDDDFGSQVPARTIGTVLFHCADAVGLLQLEVYPVPERDGVDIGYARPRQVRLHQTNEQKYPR